MIRDIEIRRPEIRAVRNVVGMHEVVDRIREIVFVLLNIGICGIEGYRSNDRRPLGVKGHVVVGHSIRGPIHLGAVVTAC